MILKIDTSKIPKYTDAEILTAWKKIINNDISTLQFISPSRQRGKPQPGTNKCEDDVLAYQLAESLLQSIQKWFPRHPSNTWDHKYRNRILTTWGKPIRAAMRGGADPADIAAVIAWLPSSEFWRKIILSGEKLKSHIARLMIEMDSPRSVSSAAKINWLGE